jgi:hypothetical protein
LSKITLHVEVLFTSSKTLEPRLKEITFGKYRISPIPTAKESLDDTHESFILEFQDLWKEGQMSSNPEKEGDFVLSLLSLISGTKVEFDSIRVNNVQGTLRRRRSSFLWGKMDLPTDLEELFKKLQSLNADLLRQYFRSCSAYRAALSLIDDNSTLSFFLLVTAVEATSNKVMATGEQGRDFKEFILRYLPKSFEDELGSKELLLLLIEEAYAMRCAFTHGGKEISIGTLSADQIERKYVKHYVEEKEVYSPSISWFVSVVQAVLLQFLRDQKVAEGQESILAELAEEKDIIHMRVAKEVKTGQVVTTKDIDVDYQKKA